MMKNVLACVVITTLYSFTGGINNIAHFGGLFGGYMMTCVCLSKRQRKRIFTSRAIMAVLLIVTLTGSVFVGIPKIGGANELQYGNYTTMSFFASFGAYDVADDFAEKILSDEDSFYSMDAAATLIISGIKDGDDDKVREITAKMILISSKGYSIMDRNIYEDLSRLASFAGAEGTIG